MRKKLWIAGVTTVVALVVSITVLSEVETMKKSDLPEAVLRAFEKSFPGVQAIGYDKETVDGKVQYEVTAKLETFEKDYIYLEDGTLLQTEEDIAVNSLPQIVVTAVQKKHAGCELEESAKITRGETIEFEVVVECEEKEFELRVAADGRILASEQIDDADDAKEENDQDDADSNDQAEADDDSN